MPAIARHDKAAGSSLPIEKHKFVTPRLRMLLQDLQHEGSSVFLSNIRGNEDIEDQVQNVLGLLYLPDSPRPATRSVTLQLRDIGGVAYTTGSEIDNDHKEIHCSLSYFKNIKAPEDARHEILGVICHELVHCFQWNAEGTCPGGLIEGIADWVRLRAGLAATHWKQEASGKWDAGYQHTGYFLHYLEQRFGAGTVRSINAHLRKGKYDEDRLFEKCCSGMRVGELWEAYGEALRKTENPAQGTTKVESKAVVLDQSDRSPGKSDG